MLEVMSDAPSSLDNEDTKYSLYSLWYDAGAGKKAKTALMLAWIHRYWPNDKRSNAKIIREWKEHWSHVTEEMS